jgi:hypothetical protein
MKNERDKRNQPHCDFRIADRLTDCVDSGVPIALLDEDRGGVVVAELPIWRIAGTASAVMLDTRSGSNSIPERARHGPCQLEPFTLNVQFSGMQWAAHHPAAVACVTNNAHGCSVRFGSGRGEAILAG